ncbi:MAG: diguanylate cyclase [Solirubrobacterales bacterium]
MTRRLENIDLSDVERVMGLSGNILWLVGADGTIIDVVGALESDYGFVPDELRGTPLRALIHPEDLKESLRQFESVANPTGGQRNFEIEVRVIDKNGGRHDVKVNGMLVSDGGQKAPSLLGLTTDITRQKIAERALERERLLFYQTFENAPNGIVLLHLDLVRGGLVKGANAVALAISGFTREAFVGMWLAESGTVETDAGKLAQALDDSRAILEGEKASFTLERVIQRPDGTVIRLKSDVSALDLGTVEDPDDPFPINAVAHIEDVTDRRQAEGELQHQAQHDSLTDLLNRRHFICELNDRLERGASGRGPGALLMIDLDDFKRVNDGHGHLAGDSVLREVARVLRDELRESDPVARLGGDEFAVLLPQADLPGAIRVADALLKRFHESTIEIAGANGASFVPSISIGITALSEELFDAEVALRKGDRAMYEAKRLGGARYAISPD